MKILIVMDPGILVPPKGYGGHERLVEMFAREYLRLGHEVHLLVTKGSHIEGCTMHPFGQEGFPPTKAAAKKAVPVAWRFLWKNRNRFDLVHNFGRLAYLFPILHHPIKKIMTYGREITSRNINITNFLQGRNILFTACSSDLLSRVNARGRWRVIYNAINFSKYLLEETVPSNAPLMFLGRIERVKGLHSAIAVAKATGEKLIIAGNISPLEIEKRYFEQEIKPHIDGCQVQYIGALDDQQKSAWLGQAKALLFPIEWNEPFGIVMIEAMACGTPVIAFNRGSVKEVIDENITGLKVNDVKGMITAVKKVHLIDRKKCQETARSRFDVKKIARQYLNSINRLDRSVVIITTGQPAANPRVVKEYAALVNHGYHVKVLYAYSADWSFRIDEEKFNTGILKRQDFIMVGGNPIDGRFHYFFSRVLFHLSKIISRVLPLPFLKSMNTFRCSIYFWIVAKRYAGDIYIAHYLGSLSAALAAAKKYGGRVIFDAEDFHRGEQPAGNLQTLQAIDIENRLLPRVDLITTASPLITTAYRKLFPSVKVNTINNVFERKHIPHRINSYQPGNPLTLFWFSQHIGPFRGLETIIQALNMLEREHIELHLMGNQYKNYTKEIQQRVSIPKKLVFHAAMPPENVFEVARKYDIGLAAEIPWCENRDICLTNKIFTYLISGVAILASNTRAQEQFLRQYPSVGLLYKHDDPTDLAKQILFYYNNPGVLSASKKNALKLATTSLNWEKESEKYIGFVNTVAQ